MAFTYTAGGTTDRDRIRARIGDTDSSAAANQRLEDEEIADLVTTEGSFRAAASAAARSLAAKFLRLATEKTVGQLALVWQRRYEDLIALSKELKASLANAAVPLAGGMSIDGKESDHDDDDLVQPAFTRDQFDNPYAAGTPSAPFDQKSE